MMNLMKFKMLMI